MATSGLRPPELLALRWRDFDGETLLVDESVSYVDGKHEVSPPKSEAGGRRVPLHSDAVAALRAKQDASEASDLVFPSQTDPSLHYGRHTLYHRWEARLKEAGLARVPLYSLRHTANMLYAAAGTDLKTAQGVMGHSDVATTLRVYSHFVQDNATRAARGGEDLLGPRETGHMSSKTSSNPRKRRR